MATTTRVLVASGHSDSDYAPRALRSGAHGFLDKTAPYDELFLAIRALHDRRLFIDIQNDGTALVMGITSGSQSVDLPARILEGLQDFSDNP
jgi:DNA-binding NarL/FixJ family response regulator